jgi:pyoverdine/dityrosine biosynthesis protein Dit1
MIRVRVDLVPFGNEDEAKEIGQLVLANDGSGNAFTGNYVFVYADDSGKEHVGSVKDFPRKQSIWKLIAECLHSNLEPHDEELAYLLWERLNNVK